jgi:hypothetical protein
MKSKPAPTTTYLVSRKNGRDQKVTVPSSWKVTFGPLNPGSRNHDGNASPALRFYEAENKQRMVITDVVCFRDMSIAIEEKRTNVKQQVMRKQTPHGEKEVVVEGRVEEWVNPDLPQQGEQEFFKLEHKADDEI